MDLKWKVITNYKCLVQIIMKAKVGFHVSIAGGISKSVSNARDLGCNAFQIFTRNPRGWSANPLREKDIQEFKKELARNNNNLKITNNSIFVHMPYLPNLSSSDNSIYRKSLNVLSQEVERCRKLTIPYLVLHLGSHQGKGSEHGIDLVVNACNSVLHKGKKGANSEGEVTLLLENSAGQKHNVGSDFEEIRAILDKLKSSGNKKYVGVCLDTCHAFAAGYDLRTEKSVDKTFDEFNKIIGMKENLKLVHLNDSKDNLSSGRDRHEHIGLGRIGLEGFKAFFKRKSIVDNVPLIMETPIDERRDNSDNLEVILEIIK